MSYVESVFEDGHNTEFLLVYGILHAWMKGILQDKEKSTVSAVGINRDYLRLQRM